MDVHTIFSSVISKSQPKNAQPGHLRFFGFVFKKTLFPLISLLLFSCCKVYQVTELFDLQLFREKNCALLSKVLHSLR